MNKNMPNLLIMKNKSGYTYVHIANREELAQASLNILTTRLKSGRYYFPPGKEPKRPDVGDVDSLPVELRKEASRVIKRWQENWNNWANEKMEWDSIQAAVQAGNGGAAWDILCRRSAAEYEGVRLERYISIEDLAK